MQEVESGRAEALRTNIPGELSSGQPETGDIPGDMAPVRERRFAQVPTGDKPALPKRVQGRPTPGGGFVRERLLDIRIPSDKLAPPRAEQGIGASR
jgi:hypothetical protein